MINLELYIDGQRLDLFKDENVLINLSIKNFQQIDKVLNDYTQSFTVPASAKNNQIFEHWYDKSVTTTFNPAVKIPARIELNSMLFRRGVIQINSATIKGGKIDYYNVTFFGGTTNLAKLFGEDFIHQLDLSAYTIPRASIKSTISTLLYASSVVVPLISTSRNWRYNVHTDPDSIRYVNSSSTGITDTELKGAIGLWRIIDAIEAKYGVTFNSDFFDSADFKKLYMWAHRDAGGYLETYNGFYRYDVISDWAPDATGQWDATEKWWILNETTFPSTPNWQYQLVINQRSNQPQGGKLTVLAWDGFSDTLLESREFINGSSNESTWTFPIPTVGEDDIYLYFMFRWERAVDALGRIGVAGPPRVIIEVNKKLQPFEFTDVIYDDDFTTDKYTQRGSLPNQTVTEFFGGLVKMFNLVIEPITETEFKIEPLDDYYSDGSDLNIGKYISVDEYEIQTSDSFGEINFEYEKSESILAKQFYESNDEGYGNLRAIITDSNGDRLSSSKFDVQLPFINLLGERLEDEIEETVSNIFVAKSIDIDFTPLIEKPYIFYLAGSQNISSQPIAFRETDGIATSVTSYNLAFQNNLDTDSFTRSLNFGSEINPFTYIDGTAISPSLYNDYWLKYITDLYDEGQRRYQFKGVIPVGVLIDLKLNATIIIGLNTYRIMSIQANLTTGEATLDLMNIIA